MSHAILREVVVACRRTALPLAWYYIVTVAIPIANGASLSDGLFVRHVLVVLALPPLLIVLVAGVIGAARGLRASARRPR